MDCRPSQPRKPTGEAMSRNVVFAAGAGGRCRAGRCTASAAAQTAGCSRSAAKTDQHRRRRTTRRSTRSHRRTAAQAQTEEAPAQTDGDAKLISTPGGKALGMSILGNQEAPKALVIVPWKSSELGNVARHLADARRLQATRRQGSVHAGAQLLRNQVGNGAPRGACAGRKRMRRSRNCGAAGGSNDFHGVAGKRRSIRRRGDGLPRRAVRLFGGADRGQAPPLPRGLRASRRRSSPRSRSSSTGESSRS